MDSTPAAVVSALLRLFFCVLGGYAFGAWMGSADAGVFAGCVLLVFCP
jgi:Flp pilus assembly protein protease CpaA